MLALLCTFSWQDLRHHPWRSLCAVGAVMLGVALALAASGLQFDPRPGKLSIAGGFGNFQGQSGLAVGLGYSYSSAMRFNAAFTAAQQGAVGVRAGASWTLN